MSLAVDGLKYEARLYITEKKYKYIQTQLDFAEGETKTNDDDPFKGVQADEVPRVSVEFSPDVPPVEDKAKIWRKAKYVKMN